MATGSLTPKKGDPGVYFLGNREIKIVEWHEGWRYDTQAVCGGGILTAGLSWEYFRDLTGKEKIDCNFAQNRRISRGHEMVINSIGVHVGLYAVHSATISTAAVFAYLCERMYLQVLINDDEVAAAPVMCFQPGIGVSGSSTDATPAGNVLSNGVPSLAAVRPLLVHQEINSENDVAATLFNQQAPWVINVTPAASAYVMATIAANDAVFVKVMLNGYIKKAVGRN